MSVKGMEQDNPFVTMRDMPAWGKWSQKRKEEKLDPLDITRAERMYSVLSQPDSLDF